MDYTSWKSNFKWHTCNFFFFTNSYPFKFIVNFTPSSPSKKVLNSMDRQGKDSAGVSSDLVFSSHGSWLPARDAGIQAMQKQSGWRSAEVFNLGTWCMPIICHHQHCFCEFLPQWLSSSCARTAFPFSLPMQYSHPVIFSSAQITNSIAEKMALLSILMEKVIRLTWCV